MYFCRFYLEPQNLIFFNNLPILKCFFFRSINEHFSSKMQPIFTVPSSTKSFDEADFRKKYDPVQPAAKQIGGTMVG